MTEIICRPKEYELEMTGHAGYAEAGKDIVCAAATILFYTLIENVRAPAFRAEISMNSGYAYVKCHPQGDDRDYCENLFEAFLKGYRLLAEEYPENVVIKEGEEHL